MLLALDSATPLVTVALHDGRQVLAERVAEVPMRHGEQLAPLIAGVLADAGADRTELTAVAVGAGPGPFTGLRVGLVTARTLGYALGISVHGICTLDILAAQAVAEGVAEEFVVATDARRKEVYVAGYTADGRRLTGPDVAKPDAVATDRFVVGPGGSLYPSSFPHRGGPQQPSAGWLAGCVTDSLAPLLPPEPLYLRRPDATPAAAAAPAPAR